MNKIKENLDNQDDYSNSFEYIWRLFSICEERQKHYSQSRNILANFLIVISGALLAYITNEGLNGNDLFPSIILSIVGYFGVTSIVDYDQSINQWREKGQALLVELDKISQYSFSDKYTSDHTVPESTKGKKMSGKIAFDILFSHFKSKEGVYSATLSGICVIGVVLVIIITIKIEPIFDIKSYFLK